MDEPLWTAEDVGEFLRVKRDTVWNMVQDGRLPHLRLANGRLRFRPASIRAWVEAQEQQPQPTEFSEAWRLAPELMRTLQERAARRGVRGGPNGGKTGGAEGNGVTPGPPETPPDLAQSCSSAAHRLSYLVR